ncbi:MAG: hypothetical protein IJH38_05240 [Clostridia bacterium]|nr:hypothetical protein [Clostridia bacterium]
MKRILAMALALLMLCTAAWAESVPDTSRIADASEMTDVEDIVPEGLVPVTGDRLMDGTWPVEVESSSSMFKIVSCDLQVADGKMTAVLHMKSDAYSYMYPGTAQEAAQAPLEALSSLEGTAFTLPVDALDAGYVCAAFSARKQAWYPRTLLFRSDSLPAEAWREQTTVRSLGLADGSYTCALSLTGGRATVESPARLEVISGEAMAHVVFSTGKIDYVLVDSQKYFPVGEGDKAAFDIPVSGFDRAIAIVLDSTAMLPATEVSYIITFDSASLEPAA